MNRYKLTKAGVDVNQGLKRLDNNKEFYEVDTFTGVRIVPSASSTN